jgi:hypothetical protein
MSGMGLGDHQFPLIHMSRARVTVGVKESSPEGEDGMSSCEEMDIFNGRAGMRDNDLSQAEWKCKSSACAPNEEGQSGSRPDWETAQDPCLICGRASRSECTGNCSFRGPGCCRENLRHLMLRHRYPCRWVCGRPGLEILRIEASSKEWEAVRLGQLRFRVLSTVWIGQSLQPPC